MQMASSSVQITFVIALSFLAFAYATNTNTNGSKNYPNSCPYEYIFQFGDSRSDTGNLVRIPDATINCRADHYPYGQNFFDEPTGRFSDGRLVTDYIAKVLNIPLLHPYLEKKGSFDHGVNFAVAGATALENRFFEARNITIPTYNRSLKTQLGWLTTYLKTTCYTIRNCSKVLEKSLIVFGEIGGNDFYQAFSQGKSIEEVKTFIPHIVEAMVRGIKKIIKYGAKRIVVPGIYPLGCFPNYLTKFSSLDYEDYDDFGCLKSYNEIIIYYNDCLERTLSILQLEYSDVMILYGDYYGAFKLILDRPGYFGFDKKLMLKACCGIGGPYNFDEDRSCGTYEVKACSDSSKYLHWDGQHLTEEAHYYVAERIISGILSKEFQCHIDHSKLSN